MVFSYKGDICEEPHPGDVSAILLARETALYYLMGRPTTVKFMKEQSATFIERIPLPDDLHLIPYGTLLTYLNLKYWQI